VIGSEISQSVVIMETITVRARNQTNSSVDEMSCCFMLQRGN
jgi:hypothetical protein